MTSHIASLPNPESRHARVTVVHLGRSSALGEQRRVESWQSIFRAAGARVTTVALLEHHRRRSLPGVDDVRLVLNSTIVPEALSWSAQRVLGPLIEQQPDVIVVVTARAFHPLLMSASRTVILDHVDRLGVSYRDRASISGSRPRRVLFRVLSVTATRFEAAARGGALRNVAAGWSDSRALQAEWVPNVLMAPAPSASTTPPDKDILFFGNLAYPPNVAALERLLALWPAMLRRRPSATALIAGAKATARLRRSVQAAGWELVENFADLGAVAPRARVAVAPLRHAAGIQNKVLEAAAHGVAQVVSPVALAGMAPGFPAVVADSDEEFVSAVLDLLDDPARRRVVAEAAKTHVQARYVPGAWTSWARQVLVEG